MKLFWPTLLIILFTELSVSDGAYAQPVVDFKRAISVNITDMVGGFVTVSHTHINEYKDYKSFSVGYMIFDGILPEYYMGYDPKEPPFTHFDFGFLLSYESSFHPDHMKHNEQLGLQFRFLFRNNYREFDSHTQILMTYGYFYSPIQHIRIYPSVGLGLSYYIYKKLNDHDADISVVGKVSVTMGYLF